MPSEAHIPALALAVLLLLAAAPKVLALGDAGDLGKFHGIWIGNSVIVEQQPRAAIVTARDIDVAIRKTKSGFDMTWRSLSQEGANRIRASLVAASEPGAFMATGVDPPLRSKEKLWAQMVGDRLLVYLSRVGGDGADYLARYALSVSDGHMTFGYTLRRGGEVLESVKGSLSRAKVVY